MSRLKDILAQGGVRVGERSVISTDFTAIETRIEAQLAEGVMIRQDGKFVPLDVSAIRTARLRGPKSHF